MTELISYFVFLGERFTHARGSFCHDISFALNPYQPVFRDEIFPNRQNWET